jgi:hypothetical protein
MAEHFDLTQPDLEPEPGLNTTEVEKPICSYSADDECELLVRTVGIGEFTVYADPVTEATFEILLEGINKMCRLAAAWRTGGLHLFSVLVWCRQTKKTTSLHQAKEDFFVQAAVLKSELDHLGGGHGQEDVARLRRCFVSVRQQFNWLSHQYLSVTRIPKRKASDAPSPEIKTQSSSSASSHALKRACDSPFSDESAAAAMTEAAAAAVAAMTEAAAKVAADAEKAYETAIEAKKAMTNEDMKAQALVAVAALADKRAKKADEGYENDEDVVIYCPQQPLPEGKELAVCDRCGCPDGLQPGARICLNCTVAKLSQTQC